MKKKILILFMSIIFVGAMTSSARAVVFELSEYNLNIDGTTSFLGGSMGGPFDPVPAGVDISGFDDVTGLGTIDVTITGTGAHFVDLFVDIDIDEVIKNFFNETGATSGSPATIPGIQSWEIDEPGFGSFPPNLGTLGIPYEGDIFDNFLSSTLDNLVFFDADDNQSLFVPDDVSMAMGWDFTLNPLYVATITFDLSLSTPSGFFLSHTDPDSAGAPTIYFSSTLSIDPIPEPSTFILLGIGLAGLGGGYLRRKFRKNKVGSLQ